MPLHGLMTPKQRPVNPPHVPLRALRKVADLTVEEVAAKVAEVLGLDAPLNRGTISAIETGKRGASRQMLDAIAVAYGLEPGTITTDYGPRDSKIHKAAS